MTTLHPKLSPNEALNLTKPRSRKVQVGLVAGGLGAYWPQFPDLLPQLQASAAYVSRRMADLDCEVVDAGFVSDAQEGAKAAEQLRVADCDLIVAFLTTYMTASMIAPIALRTQAPVLLLNLQPTPSMDHANFDTGQWLAYCGACPIPEIANTFRRLGVDAASVSGYLTEDLAWTKVHSWIAGARARAALRTGRHGLLGHLYPGMMDVSCDPTLITSNFGGHVEILEIDDLRVLVEQVKEPEILDRMELTHSLFSVDETVADEDFHWAAQVSVAMDRLVEDFDLDTLAYYHRGLAGETHERVAAGMILGASLLTARGVPSCGEYELRTSIAMLIMDRIGGGGAFTELQALNFDRQLVEMGHDGPGHLALSDDTPLLRGLGVFHGKRGWGLSVEFGVRKGPVTLLGLGQERDGSFRLIMSEGEAVDGPRLQIGNTTSLIDFGRHPGEWTDDWSVSGIGHHWALSTGHHVSTLLKAARLLGVDAVVV
jgi:L-arabinose isomerase